jgi:hypothetical protein
MSEEETVPSWRRHPIDTRSPRPNVPKWSESIVWEAYVWPPFYSRLLVKLTTGHVGTGHAVDSNASGHAGGHSFVVDGVPYRRGDVEAWAMWPEGTASLVTPLEERSSRDEP